MADALELFDSIRSPHYTKLYGTLDRLAAIKATLLTEGLSVDEEIEERVRRISLASESWMYDYEIDKVVDEALQEADKLVKDARLYSMREEAYTASSAKGLIS